MAFIPSDFSSSKRWRGGGVQSDYHDWEARTATEAHNMFVGGYSPSDVLCFLAEARRKVAAKSHTPDAELFGAARQKRSVTHLGSHHTDIALRAERNLTVFTEEPLRWDSEGYLQVPLPRLTRRHSYSLLSEERVETTRVGKYLFPTVVGRYRFNAGTIVFEHTVPDSITPIVDDILRRLETLPKKGKKAQWRLLVEAMFGYYHAMPFIRGSAGIGKLFFTVLFLRFFDRKFSSESPDHDLLAMSALDENEFHRDLLGQNVPTVK